ncbi:heme-binding protein [Congregibacter variabilis]|uniref:Heme-binding protein n=1 Tax=Congregibacter variabilis TaxID=3081200 RepID=A0ABZ0I5E0_9GAMM|nr:heme-binding protein [Congregibacter sp. IMCC43200]
MAADEPSYTLLEKSGDFELRIYDPMIIAETLVSGEMDSASNQGFRLIAGYIFGKNSSRTGEAQKISMTTPVTMQAAPEKINMTSPVTTERVGERWRIHFVMPSEYSMETLPIPDNPAVTLREVPATHYAVLRFSGLVGEKKRAVKIAELQQWLAKKNISPTGSPELARYDPPWTLPFLRRNEILIQYQGR